MGVIIIDGRVLKDKEGYFVEVKDKKHHIPKGCFTIKEEQLKTFMDKKVEVLFSDKEIVAIRHLEKKNLKLKPPIIYCYLIYSEVVFTPEILEKIQPILTRSLIEENILDPDITQQLDKWQQAR